MMTVAEAETAHDIGTPTKFLRHPLEAPDLLLERTFYPIGFPTLVRTNSSEILDQAEAVWKVFDQRFDTEIIQVDVHVLETGVLDCPPTPEYRMMLPLLVSMADTNNYSIADLSRNRTQIAISRAALHHFRYLRYFFLESAPYAHIATRYTTPVHAACVAMDGCGVLLCGESGAGKSTLAYACARVGWDYISDDSSFLINSGRQRLVMGQCHQIRFRPSACELFPEIAGMEVTPRAAGKPSIEVPTAMLKHVTPSESASVEYMVFLNRTGASSPQLVPYCKEVARQFLREVLYGTRESLTVQYEAIERLLTAEVLELRYSDLSWAIERLHTLVRKGE